MGVIFCKIPRAGLGNQLFVISKALLFSQRSNLKVLFLNAQQIKIGPYLRGERTKRNYSEFFNFQRGYFFELLFVIFYKRRVSRIKIIEPKIDELYTQDIKFSEMPHYSEYFDELIPYRNNIIELIFNNLTVNIQKQIFNLKKIDVAVHVRLGDFQKLSEGLDFKNVGATRTPFSFYIEEINRISRSNPEYKFTIFSDGHESELKPLLKLNNTSVFKSINDLVDLYQMSKSKILITSAGSTYSYWAGFLGECEIVQHPDHFCKIK
jgi:hypothetical protein